MRLKYLVLFLMIVLLVAPVMAQDESSGIEWVDCWMELPDTLVEGENVDCGYLNVPEDRSTADSNTIQLAFAVMYASADEVQPDPLIYLAGGPGGNAVAELPEWEETPYIYNRDLILLDQRGTGYSLPTLNCTEVDQGFDDSTQACHDRLVDEGIDLQAYNSAENAADLNDLRIALGYEVWNVYGISYGTRLALTLMRDYPDGIRSVIIDSVYPPEVNSWEEYGQNTADMFNDVFAGCAADEQCNAAYPDLEQTFADVVTSLNAETAEYTGTDANGDSVDQFLSGDDFINRIFQILYSSESIPYIPLVITEVANGNYAALDDLETGAMLERNHRRQSEDEDISDSEGMNFSVECQEEIAFNDEATALANVPAEPAWLYDNSYGFIQSTFADCQIWNVATADPVEAEPVESNISTLVAAGEYDPITPAKWAESAASYLPNSFYFLFPGGGHGVIDMNDCSTGIMQAFLDDPYSEPDGSCIDDMYTEWVLPS